MRTIETAKLQSIDSAIEGYHIYNALDCAVTNEVAQELLPQLKEYAEPVYEFACRLQAPVLEMCMRGIRVDLARRAELISLYDSQCQRLQRHLNDLAIAVWDKPLNPLSPQQLQQFFYGTMKLPKQYALVKGKRALTTNDEALGKLIPYGNAAIFVNHIRSIRDLRKKLGFLRTGIEKDARMRSSFNIAGTETGRFSSSAGAFGSGTNLQNVTDELRNVFVADPGYKLAYIDLEQAESRLVGVLCWHLFGDPTYLDACESGDLHTLVCKMVWPELPWPGDPKGDRAIADQPFFRHFSYRDMAKRGGHGTNYYGKPFTMARHLKVDTSVMESFQQAYFSAFPAIRRWHTWTSMQLTTKGKLTTPFLRTRHFFGRLHDEGTLREAIAFVPQSSIADLMNEGLYRIWHQLPDVHVLAQVHDAVLIQYPEEREAELLPQACKLLEVPFTIGGRTTTIPTEAKTGWNWATYSEDNPDGLSKGTSTRKRTEDPEARLVDRLFS